MTINTSSYTSPFNPVLSTWQDTWSDYSSALIAPIQLISDEVINMVAQSKRWFDLGLKLGVSQVELETIKDGSDISENEAAFQVLYKWVENTSSVATPAALCNALDDLKLTGIVDHIKTKLILNNEYFRMGSQSSADPRYAPAPTVSCCYYGEYPQFSSGSRPAFIVTNPPRPQECAAMGTDAAGQQSAPVNITSYFGNPPHSSAGIRPALINREGMNQPPRGCRRLTGDAVEHESILTQTKSELNIKNQELEQARSQVNLLNVQLSAQKDMLNKLHIENECLKSKRDIPIHEEILRLKGVIAQLKNKFRQTSSDKALLKVTLDRLRIERDKAINNLEQKQKEIILAKTENDKLRRTNKDLLSAAQVSESHSGSLPSAAIVPGKNKRGACGDDSERSAKKPKPETR